MNTYTLTDNLYDELNVIGISSHVKEYKLCLEINKKLGWQLKRHSYDISIKKKEGDIYFPTYIYESEDGFYILQLFSNQANNYYLISKYKNIDYFLMIEGNLYKNENELIQDLRGINHVLTAFKLNMEKNTARDLFLSLQH